MKRIILFLIISGAIAGLGTGCSKQEAPAGTGGGMATQGTPPTLTDAEAGMADQLAELTRELKKWIISTKERPASFEDFAAKAKITVPPAPEGKKFAISKEMRVTLVDR